MVPICPQYCANCTKFGMLILRKIVNIVATRCHILKLKCTKLDFSPLPLEIQLGKLTVFPQIP